MNAEAMPEDELRPTVPSPLDYLRPLVEEIGPRGSTTAAEAAAAD